MWGGLHILHLYVHVPLYGTTVHEWIECWELVLVIIVDQVYSLGQECYKTTMYYKHLIGLPSVDSIMSPETDHKCACMCVCVWAISDKQGYDMTSFSVAVAVEKQEENAPEDD